MQLKRKNVQILGFGNIYEFFIMYFSFPWTGKDLVTENHLQFFSRRRGKLAEQIELLERLHYCLEVVVLLEQQFKLPQTTISASAR